MGTVRADGSSAGGSGSWHSHYDAARQRFLIEFDGAEYDTAGFITTVTPLAGSGQAVHCNTNADAGRLVVVCYEGDDVSGAHDFQFVTYAY